jgi:hypothetical protein
VTVVSPLLAARPDVHATGETFTGRRLSGQSLILPLVRLPAIRLGSYVVEGHVAAVADLGAIDGPMGFAGILSPGFFGAYAVITDPDAMTLAVSPAGDVDEDGHVIPLEIRRAGISLDPFATLVLPSGREIQVEVDTGSENLTSTRDTWATAASAPPTRHSPPKQARTRPGTSGPVTGARSPGRSTWRRRPGPLSSVPTCSFRTSFTTA